jgi:hypothetical protein
VTYRVLGFSVAIETNDERVVAAADRAFNPAGRVVVPATTTDLRVRLIRQEDDEEPGWQPRPAFERVHESLATLNYSRVSSVAIDLAHGYALGFLTDELLTHPAFLQSEVLSAVVYCWAAANVRGLVHAAAVARDDRSLMLRGRAGSGKSTLAYALVRRGWSLIGEDFIFVRDRGEGCAPCFAGSPWAIHLLPDAVRFFPELAGTAPHDHGGEPKLAIDVAAGFPAGCCDEAAAGPLVFVERASLEQPRLTLLSVSEAVRRLAPTRWAYEPTDTAPGTLWGLFLSQSVYLLESSRDPTETATLLETCILKHRPS